MRSLCRLALLILALGALRPVTAADNMIGQQSQNEGISVLPAPKVVTIDGDLSEWDWSGRIWVFADTAVRDRYSVEVGAMWDAEYLYLAAKWKDPTPMFSVVNPAHNPGDGWKSDAWQMRVRTADQTSWVTTWFYTATKTPVMSVVAWKDASNLSAGTTEKLLIAPPGGTDLGEGAQLAYKKDADGQGYVQELRLPWKLLYRQPPAIWNGATFRLGMEFLWGADDGGRSAPTHRYADNMQPGVTTREFFWTAWNAWGDARLLDHGQVTKREYVPDTDRIAGTIPVRLTVPAAATRFTAVIEDQEHHRVRNLAGDCDPLTYALPPAAGAAADTRTVQVLWDGRDDAGKLVAPGTYAVRGLAHNGITPTFGMSFYNPGTPPWSVADGSGGWMADHHGPCNVLAAGDLMILVAPFAEGGFGIIGIGPDGRKRWSQYRGGAQSATDGTYIYAYADYSWSAGDKDAFLTRYAVKDGAEQPYILDGKARTFELSVKTVLGSTTLPKVTGMAARDGLLVLALDTGNLALVDAQSATLRQTLPLPQPGALAFAADGSLVAVSGTQVVSVDLATGKVTPRTLAGLGTPAALAFDREGNLLVADRGADSQVKAFAADGHVVYTCGVRGGRPLRGVFNEQAMVKVSGVAADASGQVWAVEKWDYPRRVGVWGRDGKLVRDYLGNTGYSGVGCFLHDQDPALAYCGAVELKVDQQARTWKVSRILWVPDAAKGECFPIDPLANTQVSRFTSAVAGAPHEYLYAHGEAGPHVLYLERANGWQPVAAVCLIGQMLNLMDYHLTPTALPGGDFAGLDPADACFWNDTNGDGIPQRSECEILPAAQKSEVGKKFAAPALGLWNGWGGRMGADLVFYTVAADGKVLSFKPLRIASDGAPVYGSAGLRTLPVTITPGCDTIPVVAEQRLLVVGGNHGGGEKPFAGIALATERIAWTYPNRYAGVHGSHLATMPKPGLLIGPLKICGTADLGPAIGTVFLVRGNLGQDFVYTSDGLCVGAMFRDCRLPGPSLPPVEAALRDQPMGAYTEGSEPFNGWFGKQADGKVRQVSGFGSQSAIITEIHGLDTIRRCAGQPLVVDAAALAQAEADNAARSAQLAAATKGRVPRFAAAPKLGGDAPVWASVPPLTVSREGQPEQAAVRLAHDDQNLYLRCDVKDPSPWKNEGQDFGRLFKTGDCVDLQLRTNPDAKGDQPQAGDVRLLFANLKGQPAAVLMVPVAPGAAAEGKRRYSSPVGTKEFDRVELLPAVQVVVQPGGAGYRLEAVIPLTALGLTLTPGRSLRGDVGLITGDEKGMSNTARLYWSNRNTNLISDLPLEAWLYPATWGELIVE